jgi:molybdenum-dependent DNA-binding transcriptional regulator ModE
MPEIRIDKQLYRLLKNPGLLEALVALIGHQASPSELAETLNMSLKKAIYYTDQLEKMNMIELVDTERRRGQLAHVYRAVMRPVWKSEDWAKLSQDERESYASWAIQLFLADVAIAWAARTFQARVDAHTSRSPLNVDEQGWRDLNRIQDEALAASREVEVESDKRRREAGDDAKPILVRAAMFCIEMPAS